ncbi:hypothetical protein SS50377_24350 [Spironucleus salmonicida]|uniref:Uncharacterized protein n=1 Tax=Spironucleus salmonicida TaxID=348837 RepID=V6LPD0_9EUKA|nr:hypothetical protein SS50377_24350 [Spironucleus salmonicida]|eukprot:EST46098.1 Hypothetical protein SS50377_14092 [Spironucleus salmonicida]
MKKFLTPFERLKLPQGQHAVHKQLKTPIQPQNSHFAESIVPSKATLRQMLTQSPSGEALLYLSTLAERGEFASEIANFPEICAKIRRISLQSQYSIYIQNDMRFHFVEPAQIESGEDALSCVLRGAAGQALEGFGDKFGQAALGVLIWQQKAEIRPFGSMREIAISIVQVIFELKQRLLKSQKADLKMAYEYVKKIVLNFEQQ